MTKGACLNTTNQQRIINGVMTLMLAGCVTTDPYAGPPPIAASPDWSVASAPGGEAELANWWRTLGDPELNRLVEAAITHNLDLRQAVSNLGEARAAYEDARGAAAPTVDANASVTVRRQSENGAIPIGSLPGVERDQVIYEPNFDAAWEMDLFGRLARRTEAAEARLGAAADDLADLQVSIAAEVVRTYASLRGAQRELAALERSVEALRRTTEIARTRARFGDIPPGDLHLAEAEYADALAALPNLRAQLHSYALALGVLTGQPPETELDLMATAATEPNLTLMPVGARADLLRRRPDILAAERRLAAATADTGAARAEWFPRLTITARGGFQALSGSDVLSDSSVDASIIPLISWRIFDGGRVRAEIHAAEARQERAALAYEAAVLEALRDAENSLSVYNEALASLERRHQARDAYMRAHALTRLRYDEGDVSLDDLLTSERRLRNAETEYAHAQTAAATALASLYKALGGGWDVDARADAATLRGRTP